MNALDADSTLSRSAFVNRSENNPPTLSEWENFDGVTGAFIEPFRQALKVVKREQAEEEEQ